MRKRAAASPVEVYFLTDPLCPWSWAMDPLIASIRSREDLEFRPILTGWLPSLAARGVDAVRKEWADAAAMTGAGIDPSYWDRVAPKTGLIADVAVKAAELQGAAKGGSYLAALRRAIFQDGADATDGDALVSLAEPCGVTAEMFRGDLGVGRYTADDVVAALDPAMPLAESVWWFGRRKMLRSWDALSADIRNAERQRLASPAFHILHGKKEAVLPGLVTPAQVDEALRAVQ